MKTNQVKETFKKTMKPELQEIVSDSMQRHLHELQKQVQDAVTEIASWILDKEKFE